MFTPFAKPRESLPVGSIFYSFGSCSFVPSIGSIAPPWPFVHKFTEMLFIQQSLSALEGSTLPSLASMCALGRESWVETTTTPKILPNVFAACWLLLRNAQSKGHQSRYITLFFKGAYSVISFYEVMGLLMAGLMHFLR